MSAQQYTVGDKFPTSWTVSLLLIGKFSGPLHAPAGWLHGYFLYALNVFQIATLGKNGGTLNPLVAQVHLGSVRIN